MAHTLCRLNQHQFNVAALVPITARQNFLCLLTDVVPLCMGLISPLLISPMVLFSQHDRWRGLPPRSWKRFLFLWEPRPTMTTSGRPGTLCVRDVCSNIVFVHIVISVAVSVTVAL